MNSGNVQHPTADPKFETRNPKQIQTPNDSRFKTPRAQWFRSLAHSEFGFVSDFGFRISGFRLDVGCWMLLLLALTSASCVSKSTAQNRERAAYTRGQQEALARMQQAQTQGQGPCVTVNGDVRNHAVPWTQGMTLAKAIAAADYYGAADPTEILIVHNGIARRYQVRQLLSGVDIPLQPGDIVQLMQQPTAPALQAPPAR